MYVYSATQWLFFFMFYSIVGWCFETTYVSMKQKHFTNRGFMHGPYLPIYGSGAIVMLFATLPVRDNLVLSFLFGMIAATILEYVTGVAMEALFEVRYWDYSYRKIQFQGHICLVSSIAWGFFTLLLTRVIHKPVERLNLAIPEPVLEVLVTVVAAVMLVDFTLSVRAAISLRDVLVKMEAAKKELELMQKRLDVLLAFSEDSAEKKKQEILVYRDELLEGLEERFAALRNNAIADSVRNELEELREKYIILRTRNEEYWDEKKRVFEALFRKYPGVRSVRFKEALEHVKGKLGDRK